MKIFNRHQKQDTEYRAGFTDGVVSQILAGAEGINATADILQTFAAEYAIGLISRSFAVGRLDPEIPGLGPSVLADFGRSLLVCGNYVAALEVADGGIRLVRAASWDIEGGYKPQSWRYRLDLPGPSRFTSRRISEAGVVHIKVNANPSTPWKGRSPLEIAGVSSAALAMLELRLSQEVGQSAGNLLPVPEGMDDDPLNALKADIKNLNGKTALVESTTSGYGTGRANAPLVDWLQRRIGWAIPEHNVIQRRDLIDDTLTACGIPASLRNADGAALREGYRQFLTSTIQPLADIAAAELSDKLERPISLSFGKLAAVDIAARARAYGTLVTAGMDEEEAKHLAGLIAA